MRLNRNTFLFLLGSLLVIGAALVLINQPTSAPSTTDLTPSDTFSGPIFGELAPTDLTQLTIQDTALGQSRTFQRTEAGDWSIADTEGEADQTAINSLVTEFASLQATDRFNPLELQATLADYGLESPVYDIIGNSADGTFRLRLGNANTANTRRYALVGDDNAQVYLVTNITALNSLANAIAQAPLVPTIAPTPAPVLNIPGRIYPNLTEADVSDWQVTDNLSGDFIRLSRAVTSEWELSNQDGPITEAVDSLMVILGLQSLTELFAVDAITGADLAALGLDAPVYTLRLTDTQGRNYTLQVGASDLTNTRYYVQVDAFPTVAVVAQQDLNLPLSLLIAPPIMPPTPEATPEITPEVTAEVTPEITPEVTTEAD